MPRATDAGEAKTYASLDWLKLILSLAIVCIHADLWQGEPPVILWCAVPLFFVMSSYFVVWNGGKPYIEKTSRKHDKKQKSFQSFLHFLLVTSQTLL